MAKRRHERVGIADRTVIIATIIGISVAIFLVEGFYNPASTLIGFALLATLHASDSGEDERWSESISFALAWALAFILLIGLFVINPYIHLVDQTSQKVMVDPYKGKIPQLPTFPWFKKTFGDEAPNVVSAVIGVAVAIIVLVVRLLVIIRRRPSSTENVTADKALRAAGESLQAAGGSLQVAGESLQKTPGFREVVTAVILLNIPLVIWYLVITISRFKRRRV